MEYLRINKIGVAAIALAGIVVLVGCRKDDPIDFPAPHSGGIGTGGGSGGGGSTFTPITGTSWTDINPDAGDRINALATVNNKLFICQTWLGGISALYDGNTFAYCNQTFAAFGSGSGIEKMQQSDDGTWLGTGSMGAYGAYSFDVTNAGYPWSSAAYILTNGYSAVSFNGDTYVACGQAPRVRKNDAQLGNDLDGAVFDLIEFEGELIAGGGFANSGATALNNVAKWDGNEWLPLGTGLDGTVMDLEIYNGQLVAVGGFDQNGDGNTNCRNVAVWDGVTWQPLGTGITGSSDSGRKALANGTELFIAGTFSSGDGVLSPNIIKWNGSGYEAVAGGAPETIGEMAIFEGKLYIANQFNITNGNFLLRLD